jgi:hypothetical protein
MLGRPVPWWVVSIACFIGGFLGWWLGPGRGIS